MKNKKLLILNCLMILSATYVIFWVFYNIYKLKNILNNEMSSIYFYSGIIILIILLILNKFHDNETSKISKRKTLLQKQKINNYLRLFLLAIKDKNIGKAEFIHDHFLNKTVHTNFCYGILLGARIMSNSVQINNIAISDLNNLIDEFSK